MQQIEQRAEKIGFSRLLMMENAGRAVADVVSELFDPILHQRILAVCGTGNNGGDCISAARHLSSNMNVTSVLIGNLEKIKTEEAKQQWFIAKNAPMKIYSANSMNDILRYESLFNTSDIVLDGIFGTGVRAPIEEPFKTAIKMINKSSGLKISIDVPSGMNPDTGQIADAAVLPDITIVLHSLKTGLLKQQSKCGILIVKEIGIALRT